MVLGDCSRDRGALADQISAGPDLRAGIAYVQLEGNPDPVRVRAAWVSDEDIEAMCVRYAPSPPSTSPVSEMSHERAHDLADRRPVPALRHRPLPDRRPAGNPVAQDCRLCGWSTSGEAAR